MFPRWLQAACKLDLGRGRAWLSLKVSERTVMALVSLVRSDPRTEDWSPGQRKVSMRWDEGKENEALMGGKWWPRSSLLNI